MSVCSWWGLGNVSGPRSWINGSYALRVVAHEQGHNFGNYHSHALKCDGTGCVSVEYGDDRDVLGATGVVGHMGAFQKERLGWLNYGVSPAVQTVTATGTYFIDAYETPDSGLPKGLRIWNPVTSTYNYLEARTKVGFDANVAAGVTLRTGSPTTANSAYQQDLAPTTTTWASTLDVGQTYTDAAAAISFTTLSAGTSGALLQVDFGSVPCLTAAPTVSLSPSTQSGAAGASFTYTMTATNRNSSGCAASPIVFAVAPPAGWTASLTPSSVPSVSPGASVSTTLALASPANASGSNAFQGTATDDTSGLGATASGTANVLANLNVTASATFTQGTRSRYATIAVGVASGAWPVSGAAVSLQVIKPSGATTTLSSTTGASGATSVKYTLSKRDPSGVYTVHVTASASGATGSTTTSVTVP